MSDIIEDFKKQIDTVYRMNGLVSKNKKKKGSTMNKKRTTKTNYTTAAGIDWTRVDELNWSAKFGYYSCTIEKTSEQNYLWTVMNGTEFVSSGRTRAYAFWDAAFDLRKSLDATSVN